MITAPVRSERTLRILAALAPSLFDCGLGLLRVVDRTGRGLAAERFVPGAVTVRSSFPDAVVHPDLRGYRHRPLGELERGGPPLTVGVRGEPNFSVGVSTVARRVDTAEWEFSSGRCAARRGWGGGRVLAEHEGTYLSDRGIAWRAWEVRWETSGELVLRDPLGVEVRIDPFAAALPERVSVSASAPPGGACDFFAVRSGLAEVLAAEPMRAPRVSVHSAFPPGISRREVTFHRDIVFGEVDSLRALASGEVAAYDPCDLGDLDALGVAVGVTDPLGAFAADPRRSLRAARALRDSGAHPLVPRSARTVSGPALVDRGPPVLWATCDAHGDDPALVGLEALVDELPLDVGPGEGVGGDDPAGTESFLADLAGAVPVRHRERLAEILLDSLSG